MLYVPELTAAPLDLDDSAGRGDQAVVAGFPGGGPFRLVAARVRDTINARGPDIYHRKQVTREVFSLFADVEPGNSGGPLLSPDGDVYGVVFAKSLDDPNTGYALTVDEARSVARAGRGATRDGRHRLLRLMRSGTTEAEGAGRLVVDAAARWRSGSGRRRADRRRRCRTAARSAYGSMRAAPRAAGSAPRAGLPRARWVRPTASWASPCHRSRSASGAAFQVPSSTSWAWNGRPASSSRCASTRDSAGGSTRSSGTRSTPCGVVRQRPAEPVAGPVVAGPAGGSRSRSVRSSSVIRAPVTGRRASRGSTVVNADGSSSCGKWPTPGIRCQR